MTDETFMLSPTFLKQNVIVVVNNVDDIEGNIIACNSKYIIVESRDFVELVPWTSICEIYVDRPIIPPTKLRDSRMVRT